MSDSRSSREAWAVRRAGRTRSRFLREVLPIVLLIAALAVATLFSYRYGVWRLEHEEVSEYSHIRIERKGDVRRLLFVRDDGTRVVESSIDLDSPATLQLAYTRSMFTSYWLAPNPERVLIVGLGGGGMVHFLEKHDPDLRIDAVEIDPAVVRIADEWFGVRSEGNVRVMTADAFDVLARAETRYDVLYMDAFLKPAPDTDATGVPQRMRTLAFYESLRASLTEDGVVVFNLNPHAGTEDDIRTIEEAFPGAVVVRCTPSRNLVVLASVDGITVSEAELIRRAEALDERFDADFSFRSLLDLRRDARD